MNRPITSWTDLSRRVGFEARVVAWPTGKEVFQAIEREDVFALLQWQRFLTPRTSPEAALISLVHAAIVYWKVML